MPRLKSEGHHWWPKCLSARWADNKGFTHWLLPDGQVKSAPPKNFGVIGNGHAIKFGKRAGDETVWDINFERKFQRADNEISSLVDWLESLPREFRSGVPLRDRFVPQTVSDERLSGLVESAVSLVVRSPRTRESAISLAEDIRGPLPERERNALIGMSIINGQQSVVRSVIINGKVRGKFSALYSPDREFIFGDGFYHNIAVPAASIGSPRMLIPLTPEISILYVRPSQYRTEPRFFTIVITEDEAERLNDTVQIYPRQAFFFQISETMDYRGLPTKKASYLFLT